MVIDKQFIKVQRYIYIIIYSMYIIKDLLALVV